MNSNDKNTESILFRMVLITFLLSFFLIFTENYIDSKVSNTTETSINKEADTHFSTPILNENKIPDCNPLVISTNHSKTGFVFHANENLSGLNQNNKVKFKLLNSEFIQYKTDFQINRFLPKLSDS